MTSPRHVFKPVCLCLRIKSTWKFSINSELCFDNCSRSRLEKFSFLQLCKYVSTCETSPKSSTNLPFYAVVAGVRTDQNFYNVYERVAVDQKQAPFGVNCAAIEQRQQRHRFHAVRFSINYEIARTYRNLFLCKLRSVHLALAHRFAVRYGIQSKSTGPLGSVPARPRQLRRNWSGRREIDISKVPRSIWIRLQLRGRGAGADCWSGWHGQD